MCQEGESLQAALLTYLALVAGEGPEGLEEIPTSHLGRRCRPLGWGRKLWGGNPLVG